MEVAPIQSSSRIVEEYKDRSLKAISERDERIRQAYGVKALFQQLPVKERVGTYLKSATLNADEIIQVISGSTGVGMALGVTVGAIVGACVPSPLGCAGCAGVGAATGTGVGVIVGTSVCVGMDLFSNEKLLEFAVTENADYKRFMTSFTKEEHAVFIDFVNSYIGFFSESEIDSMEEFLCSICYRVPENPVFSPHDKDLLHVYEKAEIETYLDKVEQKILNEQLGENDPDMIENIKSTADPFRGPYFKKDELVYSTEHARKVVKFLRRLHQHISSNPNLEFDPVLEEGAKFLVKHYERTYNTSNRAISNRLLDDLLKMGNDATRSREISDSFHQKFKVMNEPEIVDAVVFPDFSEEFKRFFKIKENA